jgi:hypothetical protein
VQLPAECPQERLAGIAQAPDEPARGIGEHLAIVDELVSHEGDARRRARLIAYVREQRVAHHGKAAQRSAHRLTAFVGEKGLVVDVAPGTLEHIARAPEPLFPPVSGGECGGVGEGAVVFAQSIGRHQQVAQ